MAFKDAHELIIQFARQLYNIPEEIKDDNVLSCVTNKVLNTLNEIEDNFIDTNISSN